MKRLLLAAAAAASLAAIAAPASAGTYFNLGYSGISNDDLDVNLGAVTGKLGWNSGSWFGVEGEASVGVADDTVAGVKVEVNSQFAVYGVASLPLSESANLFARIGYGTTDIKASAGPAAASGSDQSVNYGIGGQVFFGGGDNGLRAEYTKMDFNDGGDADVVSLSYVRRFR